MIKNNFFLNRLLGSHYLRESVIFVGLQQAFQVIIGLFQVWVLTAYLTREAYGVWGYVAALVAMASLFTLPGVNQAVTYGAARSQHGVLMAGVRWRLTYGLLSTLLLLIIAWFHLYSDRSQAAVLLLIAALFMPLCQALECIESFLTGMGNFKALFWRRLILHGSLSLLLWAGAAVTGSLWVCGVIHYAGGTIISAILFISLLKYRQNNIMPEQFHSLAKQFSFQSVGSTISHSMERPLLSLFIEFQQMAAYNMALTAQIPISYGRLIDRILISRLARSEGAIPWSWVWMGTWLLFGLGWMAWFGLVFILRWLVPILFPGYGDAIPLMEILLLQAPFAWGSKPGMSWFLAHPETHTWYHRLNWGIILSRILFITIGVWMAGMTGAAWSWVAVEGVSFLAVLLVLLKVTKGVTPP